MDVSTTRTQRRRLRPLAWSWDSDTEQDRPVQTRQARRLQRSCPFTQVDASSDEEVLVRSKWQACGPQDRCRTACDNSCKSGSSLRSKIGARARVPNQRHPTHRRFVFRRRRESLKPRSENDTGAGMAVDQFLATVLDALEEETQAEREDHSAESTKKCQIQRGMRTL